MLLCKMRSYVLRTIYPSTMHQLSTSYAPTTLGTHAVRIRMHVRFDNGTNTTTFIIQFFTLQNVKFFMTPTVNVRITAHKEYPIEHTNPYSARIIKLEI